MNIREGTDKNVGAVSYTIAPLMVYTSTTHVKTVFGCAPTVPAGTERVIPIPGLS